MISACEVDAPLSDGIDDACFFKTADQDKETHEEEECIQVNFFHRIIRVDSADQHGNDCAGHGDGCGIEAEVCVADEAEDGETQYGKGPVEELSVFYSTHHINLIHFFLRHIAMGQFLAEEPDDAAQSHEYGDNGQWTGIFSEVKEIQMGCGTDHDVWRIADHHTGTTDVTHKDFCDQKRYRIQFQHTAERNGERCNQESCGNCIQEGCGNSSNYGKQHQKHTGRTLRFLHGPQCYHAEETGFLDNGNQDHHACQEAQGIPVDKFFERFVFSQESEVNHRTAANERADGSRNLFRHNSTIGEEEDDDGQIKLEITHNPNSSHCPEKQRAFSSAPSAVLRALPFRKCRRDKPTN